MCPEDCFQSRNRAFVEYSGDRQFILLLKLLYGLSRKWTKELATYLGRRQLESVPAEKIL
jgi:hypothetical protein